MAYVLEVLIRDLGDGSIKVGHSFFGFSEREVQTYYREHLASDEYLATAKREGRVEEELEEVDEEELPDFEEEEEEEDSG